MQPDEVLSVVRALRARDLRVWIDGGWGVDALLGEVTRPHDDVDLVVELMALPDVYGCLSTLGFSVTEDLLPVRVVLRSSDGRQVDLHPVTFDEGGTGWQAGASPDGSDCPYPPGGFSSGRILDSVVPCLGPELQLEHHRGYPPRERDRRDMALLAARFGLHSDRLQAGDPFDASVVGAAYDAVAEDYAASFADDLLQLPLDRQVLDAFADRIGGGGWVLDLGCGPGQVGQYLADHGLRVVGLDLARQMLLVARRRTGNGRVLCADMRSLPLRSGSFSGVVAFYSVQHLPRRSLRTALAEIHRILEPSGTFVVATHLGDGEVLSSEFLGHHIETVGGNLYRDDALRAALGAESFVVEEERTRHPLLHEHDTERIYLTCRRAEY